MAEKLKIKLSIANRVYPLTILPNQEEGLRKAAKKIEAMISQFEQNYSVRDKQDVLAMCALQFASQVEQKVIDKEHVSEHVQTKLEALQNAIKEGEATLQVQNERRDTTKCQCLFYMSKSFLYQLRPGNCMPGERLRALWSLWF